MNASIVDLNTIPTSSETNGCEAEWRRLLNAEDCQTVDHLKALERFELKMVYHELVPPNISNVDAEYGAVLLSQGDRFSTSIVRKMFSSKGPWLGKGFRPITETAGEGYNVFGTPAKRKIQLPMDTYIAGSNVVSGTAFVLDYRKRNRGAICWLRGELRVLSDDMLLGMGTFGPWKPSLKKLRRTIPFLLYRTGPSLPADSQS
ncbi:hypothetical protein LOC67_13965 [Stieleria sp. JC731]|uniref:hypothetical protein n=1 Tax=Pirellulaceae TaxID=2691357 RepID=UPI001E50FCCD|nr:hypothetical protein [Stieleria sp. JC731]MCC9601660.1 hypothetical protein [Stieleria sp. JC731]